MRTDFLGKWGLAALLVAVIAAPIALRPRGEASTGGAEEALVIITPHNEAIREEFGRAFADWYAKNRHRKLRIDWRTPGGTSEIGRYLAGEYFASFRNHWERTLGRKWDPVVEAGFANSKVIAAATPEADTTEQSARRAFLASNVSCRIDLFFGGGAFDYQQQASAGRLVDSGFVREHPELFNEKAIPQTLGGEPFWDKEGRWIGTCLGAFGMCSNRDALQRLGIEHPPTAWSDLADPRYFREIALANPTQSSSVNKAFEMLIQQQMLLAANGRQTGETEAQALERGWARAMQELQKIGANARYFTDASTKVALDVGAGEAAAGMTIDFYGRFESEVLRDASGNSRLTYSDAVGGTSAGTDPIGLLRGAPNPEAAKDFIAYVMSIDGQKLWNWKVGTPGGPHRYALRRMPMLRELYGPEFTSLRSDPAVDPYKLASSFTYHESWTGPLFKQIAFIVRVMCIDPHDELTSAWDSLIRAGFPPEATACFSKVENVSYEAASKRFREILGKGKIGEVQLAKELADGFRSQYREAEALAKAGR